VTCGRLGMEYIGTRPSHFIVGNEEKMHKQDRELSRVDGPPSKVVPPVCPQQNNPSPWAKFRSYTWSPPAADCSLFAIAFATVLAYREQSGHCLFDQNKMRQHLLKCLQEGEMTYRFIVFVGC